MGSDPPKPNEELYVILYNEAAIWSDSRVSNITISTTHITLVRFIAKLGDYSVLFLAAS